MNEAEETAGSNPTRAADEFRTTDRLGLVCRLLLSALFLPTGIAGLLAPAGFAAGLEQMGVPFPAASAAATTALTLAGPTLLISDIAGLGWVAAFALAAFTVITIPYGHAFWRLDEPRRTEELRIAAEHVSVIGGLALAGLMSHRRWQEHSRLGQRRVGEKHS